ncbi:hypothetical protein, partial [Halorubrum miltondacostae]
MFDSVELNDFPESPLDASTGELTIPSDGLNLIAGQVTWGRTNVTSGEFHRTRLYDSAESIHGNLAHVSVVSDFVTNPLQREYEFTAGETIRMDVDV